MVFNGQHTWFGTMWYKFESCYSDLFLFTPLKIEIEYLPGLYIIVALCLCLPLIMRRRPAFYYQWSPYLLL